MKRSAILLSMLFHILIFSIPVSMAIKTQNDTMVLYVSMEDPTEESRPAPVQPEIKKPQPKPPKKIIKSVENATVQLKIRKKTESAVKELSEAVRPEQMEVDTEEVILSPITPKVSEPAGYEPASEKLSLETPDPVEQPAAIESKTATPIETQFGASISPTFIHQEIPAYPRLAKRLDKEGKVLLKLSINEEGKLTDIEVVQKAGYGFTEAAVEAVRKSTFLPAKKEGKAVATRVILPIKFQLERY